MPSFRFELRCEGRVAGIDEAGRGPLAGPVYAAAAVIDRTRAARKLLRMIDDSKKLTLEQREEAYEAMIASGVVQFAVAEASVEEIDRVNILQATYLAMRRAVQALVEQPEVVLVDGNRAPPQLGCRAETIVGGDAHSYSIAAASIFAKVTRDRYMHALALTYPGYGWETNRGYGSQQHLEALSLLGPTPHHRRSFAPVTRLV
ncbi:ribonuclease HII [Reyranella sp.]|jgi:ribonuclease HII|uniref:ribonuclease HII n=1 Tax=Reyranella sp. TaxID=1929291 RepID=UPI000BC5DF24|nr:ribonuclease HII [Reyranella sp.]OYY35481.1 MAG: ribonuclease HII [Rhodospirillales bacterium 35-66-84]OYZ96626.1 MAG: ribonuclease HII [Rhodospirillales bacterium 24-66-33]OZB28047.1 MAG: ribonuclease HII [Rhodospirillales bacterium 39-66-50]HQS18519.1 ribonuclease HII [Reyranella sp.]HQT09988.1 ribonuclease HII [Reyranella sp.]